MKTKGKRITLLCAGKPKRKFVLIAPPFPEIGDPVTYKGVRYVVLAIEDTEVLALLKKEAKD